MKKVIRITENELSQIITESVQKVLTEVWDYAKFRQAKREHPSLMKNIDPRTYAIRAEKGTNAQGRKRKEDDQLMRSHAQHKWTDDYGFNHGRGDCHGEWESDNLGMYGNHYDRGDYNIDRQLNKINNGKVISYGDSAYYNPKSNKTYSMKDYSSSNGVGIDIPPKGLQVARQMVKGNGKYIPNKGWQ